ncbi:MAG: GNAT family N-acetyltransferase [Bdellovibrionota bacterium]
MIIDSKTVSVRDLSHADIPMLMDYWFRSPPGFIEAMGVDLKKLPTEAEMRVNLTKKVSDNETLEISKASALVITHNGIAIGVHSLFPVTEGESGVFHAHVCNPDFRKRGVGFFSYPKACRVFIERFQLKRILFKTPKQNAGALRVKEKLGIRVIGEEAIGFGIVRDGTIATVFELTRDENDALLDKKTPTGF